MALQQKESAGTPGLSDNSEYGLTIGDASSRYSALAVDKYIYLQRARAVARVTIPMLFPPQGHSSATNYYTPFQSVGADGINNLSAKLTLALFPPGEPFFKLALTGNALQQIEDATGDQAVDARAKFETALSRVEVQVVQDLETHGARAAQTEAIKQLLISGNALIQVLDDNGLKAHRLENYVVRRDVDGHPIEVIVRETLRRQSLPDEAKSLLHSIEHRRAESPQGDLWRNAVGTDMAAADRATTFDSGAIDLFTIAYVDQASKEWKFHQEMMGYVVPGTDGTWPMDTPALIPLTWYRIQGEHYGRGHGEEYLGDLNSLEALTQAMVEFAGIASTVKGFVDETGITSIEDLDHSPNGAWLNGEVNDQGKPKNVGFLMLDKGQDWSVAKAMADKLEERLNRAFMQTDTITRDAERVTAEEIRTLAKSLEDRLGGSYAVLAQEFQRPLVRRIILNMQKQHKIPHFPDGMVRPEVIAGLEGLGRESELQKLDTLVQGAAQTFGQQLVQQYFNLGAYLQRRGAALGIDMTGLVKSDDDIAQENQQQQQHELMTKLGPGMIKAGGDIAKGAQAKGEDPSAAIQQMVQGGAAQGGVPTPTPPVQR